MGRTWFQITGVVLLDFIYTFIRVIFVKFREIHGSFTVIVVKKRQILEIQSLLKQLSYLGPTDLLSYCRVSSVH